MDENTIFIRCRDKRAQIFLAWLFSVLITGLYFLFVYQKLPFIYDINDDVAMRNVASGVITGVPDAHLLHIKYILGLVISGLYRLFPGLDWYGLVLIGGILFSCSMILYRGLVSERGLIFKLVYTIAYLLLLTCMGLQHITAFQWTTTAAIAGTAGIYLFYTSETNNRFQRIFEEVLSVFLLLFSLTVRDDVFLMMVPVSIFVFWWKYGSLEKNGRWPVTIRHIEIPAILLGAVLVVLFVEAFAYHSSEWKEFRTYNINREAIMDYYGLQKYEEEPEFFDSLGITPEEAENLQRYSLYLVDNLYSEKVASLAHHSREVYLRQHPMGERISTGIEKIYEHMGKNSYHLSNLLCLCMITLTLGFCAGKNRKQLGLALLLLCVWAAYWLYLGYRNRIIERVGFALYLLAFLTMLAIWYRTAFLEGVSEKVAFSKNGCKGHLTEIGLTAGACMILFITAGIIWREVKANNTWRRDYNLQFLDVNRYMAEHMENVYFMTTFSIETYTDNFTIRRNFAFSNLLSVGGWHTFSPLENVKAEKLGITDPKKDIVAKENVYVISLENVNLRYMERYFRSLYGEAYQGSELVDTLNYGERIFEVYDFTIEE